MSISTFPCAYLLNTLFDIGTFVLPPISSNIGLVQIFEDEAGTFEQHPLLITTTGVDKFPNMSNEVLLNVNYAHLTLVAGNDNIWYPISQLTYDELAVSTITVYSTIGFKLDEQIGVIDTDVDLRLLYNGVGFYASTLVYFDFFSVSTATISTLVVNNLVTDVLATNELHAPAILQEEVITFV